MFLEKMRQHGLKVVILLVNLGLITGGTLYFKAQQEKKRALQQQEADNEAKEASDALAAQAQKLEQIVENSSQQKVESIANNPSQVTVQQPKTVKEVIPGETKTVETKTAVKSSKSTPAPAPAKATKKS